jgi:hypothetical protein
MKTPPRAKPVPRPIPKATPLTSRIIFSAIEAAHPAPEWACIGEVGNATGFGCKRHADAIAMSLWPSRGLIIRGFEIKTSRSDYKREAKDPMKAEEIASFCNEWWIVTPQGLIKEPTLELPPAWGLMEVNDKKKLSVKRKAESTEVKPLTRAFVAAVLRGAHKQIAAHRIGWIRLEDIEDRLESARQEGVKGHGYELSNTRASLDRLRKAINNFKEITGIDIASEWRDDSKLIGEATKIGLALLGNSWDGIKQVSNILKSESEVLLRMHEKLNNLMPHR